MRCCLREAILVRWWILMDLGVSQECDLEELGVYVVDDTGAHDSYES